MFEEIKMLLMDCANIDGDKITMDANLKKDLNIGSLDAVELVLDLETKYDIQIDYDETKKLIKVKDLVDIVEEKLGR